MTIQAYLIDHTHYDWPKPTSPFLSPIRVIRVIRGPLAP